MTPVPFRELVHRANIHPWSMLLLRDETMLFAQMSGQAWHAFQPTALWFVRREVSARFDHSSWAPEGRP